jgi:hypothetical protein
MWVEGRRSKRIDTPKTAITQGLKGIGETY